MRLTPLLCLVALPASAQRVSCEPAGNFSGPGKDGYRLNTLRTILSHMDNGIAVTGYATYNNSLNGKAARTDIARCFAASCWSCEADVWNGAALAGGQKITPEFAYEDRNASRWHPEPAIELGLSPAYD